jgi:MoaA/NifB/PqqE/SkfB family radical SAM enzyme
MARPSLREVAQRCAASLRSDAQILDKTAGGSGASIAFREGIMRFDESPLLVIWESTQARDLACVHCRASAVPRRHSSELSTEEGYRLLEAIPEFGNPLMVFPGGDPLKRPDILPLHRRSVALGLRTNMSPSASPLLTRETIGEFRKVGVACMAISLDGQDAETHDGFRGVSGTFDRAVEALEDARRIGLETQIQTGVTRRNMHGLDEIASLAARLGPRVWSVLFPAAAGRAISGNQTGGDPAAEEHEEVFEKPDDISRVAPFEVTTNEAVRFRRYTARRLHERAETRRPEPHGVVGRGRQRWTLRFAGACLSRFAAVCGVARLRRSPRQVWILRVSTSVRWLAQDPRCAYQPSAKTAGVCQEA